MTNTAKHDLTLYHYWRSSCSWRVRWSLHHKGIPFNDVAINLLTGEQNSSSYLSKNPGGYVPALEIDGKFFGESLAILEWLEEEYPAKPLLPQNRLERLRVRQISQLIVSGIQPVQNLAVLKKHSNDPAEQAKWANECIGAGLCKLETILKSTAQTYCFGDTLTLADLCLVPQVYNAQRFKVDLAALPIISRINETCLKLPACEAAAPHNQKGATPT
jgi:maleylacetoacetate isomerase